MDNNVISFSIPVPPVTKKNHGQIISYGPSCFRCGRKKYTKLIPSKQYEEYKKLVRPCLIEVSDCIKKIDYPINLKCLFYCQKRYKGDLVGYLQCIQDILVDFEILEDDNRNIVASLNGSMVLYDKENPRTEIVISKVSNYEQWGK